MGLLLPCVLSTVVFFPPYPISQKVIFTFLSCAISWSVLCSFYQSFNWSAVLCPFLIVPSANQQCCVPSFLFHQLISIVFLPTSNQLKSEMYLLTMQSADYYCVLFISHLADQHWHVPYWWPNQLNRAVSPLNIKSADLFCVPSYPQISGSVLCNFLPSNQLICFVYLLTIKSGDQCCDSSFYTFQIFICNWFVPTVSLLPSP